MFVPGVRLVSGVASAKGCVKGAAVGGVVGHVAGKHGVAGAAAGCAIGHHNAKVKANKKAAATGSTSDASTAGGAQPAAAQK